MTATNRVQVALVRETTIGTTPITPRMRKLRITQGSPSLVPEYVDPEEVRDDRMTDDPILTITNSTPSLNGELSYPTDETALSELLRNAFWNPWTNTPQRDNDGTQDSVITAVTAASDTYTVTAGAAFVEGQLVRATGFTNPGNNSIFRAQAGSGATAVVAPAAPGLTDEAAPPGTARLKVVGFQGASGDITATADGLASSALDLTTLGLAVGMWIKVGGTAAADRFATPALNDWARIAAIATNALTLDNKPAGWGTDSGAGKTIKVWFGDQIRNGTSPTAHTIEFGYLGQQTPTYIAQRGAHVNTMQFNATSRAKITWQATFQGMGGAQGTSPLDASPDAPTTAVVMAANANVGRLAEGGSRLTSPNWARSLQWTLNNNLRAIESVDEQSPVAVREGECTVTGSIETYFGDNSLLAKFYGGTPTSINARFTRNGQALIVQFPRVTYRGGGDPNVGGKNQDVMLNLEFTASKDTNTSAVIVLDRLEFYE
jgi:hypothetical protein